MLIGKLRDAKSVQRGVGPRGPTYMCVHVTRFLLFSDIACTQSLHIPAGPLWFPQTLPESPRRLKTLAKAGSS